MTFTQGDGSARDFATLPRGKNAKVSSVNRGDERWQHRFKSTLTARPSPWPPQFVGPRSSCGR